MEAPLGQNACAGALLAELTDIRTAAVPDHGAIVSDDERTVIRVEDVHGYYDLGETRVHALRGVSMTVERGGCVTIMGSSGSGKSTALPTLYTPIGKEERAQRAAEALAMVGLANRADHFPSQISGAQQQRVAIARALVNRPSILFADEPTGNLDSRTAVEIMEIFQTLNDRGLTIVMVTHEPDIAQFAKRVIVFRDGKIRKDGTFPDRPRASEVLKTLPTLED